MASAFWIAISAAAPEFIWRGSQMEFSHLSSAQIASALLVGLFLAFFVEPVMQRVHRLLHPAPRDEAGSDEARSALFTASLGLAFAFVSVSVHDAMIAYLSARGEHADLDSGLAAGIALTTGWAAVPFAITLAWLSANRRWIAIPLGIVATASPVIAGWLFSWKSQAIINTEVPCFAILIVGYYLIGREPRRLAFARCAYGVAAVTFAWLVLAVLFGEILRFWHLESYRLYDARLFWIDVRFYAGWILGLLLAPVP